MQEDQEENSPLVSVSYNNTTIATLGAEETKTLQCSGKLMNSNVVVTAGAETDPIFSASAAKNITSSDISNWNGKANTSGTYSGLSVGYASSAGSAPASDVYSWAKQSSKPSYSAGEVGVTYSNVDIGEGASLATGTFYFVYE